MQQVFGIKLHKEENTDSKKKKGTAFHSGPPVDCNVPIDNAYLGCLANSPFNTTMVGAKKGDFLTALFMRWMCCTGLSVCALMRGFLV